MSKPARPKGGRPTRQAAEQIGDKIVDVARQLFFEHGYGATSVETIARVAGISKRTFYHRFENKAAIFKAVVNSLIQRLRPADIEVLFTGSSLEDILHRLAHAILQASLQPDTLALQRLMIAEATRFPELGVVMSEQGARQDLIERIAKLLGSQTQNASLAAEMFFQLVVGAPQRRALGLGKPMTTAEIALWADSAVSLFFRGYVQPSQTAPGAQS